MPDIDAIEKLKRRLAVSFCIVFISLLFILVGEIVLYHEKAFQVSLIWRFAKADIYFVFLVSFLEILTNRIIDKVTFTGMLRLLVIFVLIIVGYFVVLATNIYILNGVLVILCFVGWLASTLWDFIITKEALNAQKISEIPDVGYDSREDD